MTRENLRLVMQTKVLRINPKNPEDFKIKQAAKLINHGELVAFPTETVYGLGANALDRKAISKIFEAKGRPSDNPLIVHISDLIDLKVLTDDIPDKAYNIIEKFWPGPLTIILRKSKLVPKVTTGNLDTIAIRMPENRIAQELIKKSGVPIAAPSANTSGKPSPTLAKHVIEDLSGRIDMIIDGGKVKIGIESTVIDLSVKVPMLLRPGGITVDQLRTVLDNISIHPIVKGRKSKSSSRSPGMKYRHYSPNARIILIEGPTRRVNSKISDLVIDFKRQQKRVGVMTINPSFSQKSDMTRYIGNDLNTIAANLFKTFREFDSKKIDIILAHGTHQNGLGLGIMNRLYKAASKKIKV